MAEARIVRRVALGGVLLALLATPLLAQYKAPAPGIGAAPIITPNIGPALTAPTLKATPLPPSVTVTPSAPNLSMPTAPSVAAPAAPAAAAAPSAALRPAPMQAGRRLLKVAAWGGRSAGSCDITERLRGSWCVGNRCRLACPSNPCGGEESGCQFILECATEIVANIAMGEQPCRDVQVLAVTSGSAGGQTVRQQVSVRAGTQCDPPPCMPPR